MDEGLIAQAETWLVAAAGGDRESFHHFYVTLQPHIYRFCRRMLGDDDRAHDACQEVFVDLHRNARRYRPDGKFRSFLFTVAANRCRKWLRKRRETPVDIVVEPHDHQTPEDELLARELGARLDRALAALPDKQRAAFLLVYEQHLSYEEAAEALNARVAAVKTWIYRARQRLQRAIEEEQT